MQNLLSFASHVILSAKQAYYLIYPIYSHGTSYKADIGKHAIYELKHKYLNHFLVDHLRLFCFENIMSGMGKSKDGRCIVMHCACIQIHI